MYSFVRNYCRNNFVIKYFQFQVANRTLPFIHNCLNEIRILEVYYPDGALACWIFLCCLEIILMCQNLKENTHSDACSWYTAPLMELAVCKVKILIFCYELLLLFISKLCNPPLINITSCFFSCVK